MTNLTPEQQRIAVAGAMVDCPTLRDEPMNYGHTLNCQCKGTGRVFALPDVVRVERQGIWSHRDCKSMQHCQNLLADDTPPRGITDCQGRGWNASTRLEDWEKATFEKWPDALIEKQRDKIWLTPYYEKTNKRFGPGGFSAFGVGLGSLILVVGYALVARGAKLGEV